ncbi:hypothetical protein BgiBS90_012944 [Biomphalaria glabrata]|nr:hypothetical protein BgiBS90_012944 [Biomphalaria glabrata]
MRIEYIEVDTTDLVTMIVVYNWLSYQEAYMALPINEWRSRYIIIYSRAGFVTIISAKNNSSLNVISQEVGEEQLAITEREVELRSCQMILPMMGFVETNTFLGLYVYSDSAFGVVAGQCYLDKQSSVQNLESVLPIEDLPRYTYVAFCPEKRQCYLIVYAMVPGNFTCKKLFDDSHPCWPIKSHANIIVYQNSSNAFLIEGISPMHVVVSMTTVQTGIITLCTIIPSNIFGITYSFMLPDGFSSHYLVLVTQKPYDDLRGHVIQLLKLAFNSSENSAGVNIFVGPVTNEDTITSISQTPFGCYLFGDSKTNSYATPIHSRFYFNNYVTTSTTTTTTTPTNTSWCIPSLKLPGDNKDNDCDGYVDEEIDNSKDDDNDNKIDEDTAAYTETGCLPGWFGTKCDKLCHCNNSQCLKNGDCQENVACLPGFFGLQCQYKDIIIAANVSQEEMKFRHSFKCWNNFTVMSPLKITFSSATRITWIQIEAASKEDLMGLQLTFEKIPNIRCFTGPCQDRRDIYEDESTLIIMCRITSNICQVSITFNEPTKPRQFCAVYVNAGRNVAPGSEVKMSSYYNDTLGRVSRGSLSVDGQTKDTPLSCSSSAINDLNPVWKLSFSNVMRIDEIMLNFGAITSNNDSFVLTLKDDNGTTVYTWTGGTARRVSIIPQIRVFALSIEAVYSNSVVAICEVETYGDKLAYNLVQT